MLKIGGRLAAKTQSEETDAIAYFFRTCFKKSASKVVGLVSTP
jgi:hypothetical protein